MESVFALGICRLPAPVRVQEILDHTAAWDYYSEEVLSAPVQETFSKYPVTSAEVTKVILIVCLNLPLGKALMLMIHSKSGNKVWVFPTM